MRKQIKYTFTDEDKKDIEVVSTMSIQSQNKDASIKILKKELVEVFRKFGYLENGKDIEVRFRTTSGNVAWININSIEILK